VAFTKEAVDGLPITQFKVGEAPCAISTDEQANKDNVHYLLEKLALKSAQQCPKAKLTEKTLDARFSVLDIQTSLG